MAAILDTGRRWGTQFWKGTTQGSSQQSLVEIISVVSEEKIFFLSKLVEKYIPENALFNTLGTLGSVVATKMDFWSKEKNTKFVEDHLNIMNISIKFDFNWPRCFEEDQTGDSIQKMVWLMPNTKGWQYLKAKSYDILSHVS